MARTQQTASLVLSPQTVRALYPDLRKGAPRPVRVTEAVLDVLPEPARMAIDAALARGGCEALLLHVEENRVQILIRNIPVNRF